MSIAGLTRVMGNRKLEQAEEIARQTFRQHYAGRRIPDEIVRRLGRSIGPEGDNWKGNRWEVNIVLSSDDPTVGSHGLWRDLLDPPGTLLITIHVDGDTGKATLIEHQPVPW